MSFNLHSLSKSQLLFLVENKCRHRMPYIEHPACFWKEHPDGAGVMTQERVGFIDIEATSLNASFGYMLCYCLLPENGPIVARSITPSDVRGYTFDKKLIAQFVKDIEPYDRLVGYYSKDYRYDIPFLRTRALLWGVDFPLYKEKCFSDCYDLVKKKMKLHRSRLETACEFLGIPSKGHRLNPQVWQRAQAGDKESLDYVMTHCKEDVKSLRTLWNRLNQFDRIGKTSI